MAYPRSGQTRDTRQDQLKAVAWGPSSLEEPTRSGNPLSGQGHERQMKMSVWAGQGWTFWELGVRFSSAPIPTPHNSRLWSCWASLPDLETSLFPLGRLLGSSPEWQSPGKRQLWLEECIYSQLKCTTFVQSPQNTPGVASSCLSCDLLARREEFINFSFTPSSTF